jgi:hypothetical protein
MKVGQRSKFLQAVAPLKASIGGGGGSSASQSSSSSSKKDSKGESTPQFERILDRFKNVEDVQDSLRQQGLESCNLVVGIDFTSTCM